jgi:hypothetical protein
MAQRERPVGPLPDTIEELCEIGTRGHSLRKVSAHLTSLGYPISREMVRRHGKVRSPEEWHQSLLQKAVALENQARRLRVADPDGAETLTRLVETYRLLAARHALGEKHAAASAESMQEEGDAGPRWPPFKHGRLPAPKM